jgi:NADH-quinone oxidoreductase subunit E
MEVTRKIEVDSCEVTRVIDEIVTAHPEPTGLLIHALNRLQEIYRYVPEQAIEELHRRTGIDDQVIIEFVHFFASLSFDPVGRYVLEVCDGTACHATGARMLLRALELQLDIGEGQTSADGMLTLRCVNCVGACSQAPVIVLGEQVWGRVSLRTIPTVVQDVYEMIAENATC